MTQPNCAAANAYGRYCERDDESVEQIGQLWLCTHHARMHKDWARRFVETETSEIRELNQAVARAREQAAEQSGLVYYLEVEPSPWPKELHFNRQRPLTLIKIGTTQHLRSRITAHRRSYAMVNFLVAHPGYMRAEAAIHDRFSAERVGAGELFLPSARLMAHIDHVRVANSRRQRLIPDPSPALTEAFGPPRQGCPHGSSTKACSTCKCEARGRAKARTRAQAGAYS